MITLDQCSISHRSSYCDLTAVSTMGRHDCLLDWANKSLSDEGRWNLYNNADSPKAATRRN